MLVPCVVNGVVRRRLDQKGRIHPVRRTLLVTNDFPPRTGGIQSYVQSLAERLPPDDLVVYAPAWTGAAEFDARQPFPIFRHPGPLMLPSESVRARAAELIREQRIGALWFGAAAPLSLMTPRLRGEGVVRTVASTHGHEVGWAMVPGARRALRKIGRSNDVITFVSQFARRRISSALGPTAALEYLPPGVRTSTFRPDPLARRRIRERYGLGDTPVLLCVSRLVARKGQDRLIRALPTVLAQVPDVTLLVVGDGPQALRLRTLAERLGLCDRVVFTGHVEDPQLRTLFAGAQTFVFPSRHEGFALPPLEAMSFGAPCIVADATSLPEVVGDAALLFRAGDSGALAAAIERVLTEPELRDDLSHAGVERARLFSWAHTADASIAVYHEVLGGGMAAPEPEGDDAP